MGGRWAGGGQGCSPSGPQGPARLPGPFPAAAAAAAWESPLLGAGEGWGTREGTTGAAAGEGHLVAAGWTGCGGPWRGVARSRSEPVRSLKPGARRGGRTLPTGRGQGARGFCSPEGSFCPPAV